MLAIKPKVQFFTREITAPNGEAVLGLFAVSEINGLPRVRLVAVKPVSRSSKVGSDSTILAIAGSCSNYIPEIIFDCFNYVPEFSTRDFSFFNSQPTRAPSFA